MPINCQEIKKEYEKLKALKEAFVFDCEKLPLTPFDAAQGDTLKKLKIKKQELEEATKALERKLNIVISVITKEGKEIRFDMREQVKYWSDFYRETGVDWITMPEMICPTAEQIEKMKEMMAEGFDKMIIIPENLVDEPQITYDSDGKPVSISNPSYERLHCLMSSGYECPELGGNRYRHDGNFQGAKDKTRKLRVILTKDIKELSDNHQFKATMNKSIVDLEKDELKNYTGFSESSYLVYQRDYFRRTGQYLDTDHCTWLPESSRPLSGRVCTVDFLYGYNLLSFDSDTRSMRLTNTGCRLAGTFEIEK